MNRKGYTEDYNKDKPSYKTIEIIPIPSEKKYLISYDGKEQEVTKEFFGNNTPMKNLRFEKDGVIHTISDVVKVSGKSKYFVTPV